MLEKDIETLLKPNEDEIMKVNKEVLEALDLVMNKSDDKTKEIIKEFKKELDLVSNLANRRIKRNKLKKIKEKYIKILK